MKISTSATSYMVRLIWTVTLMLSLVAVKGCDYVEREVTASLIRSECRYQNISIQDVQGRVDQAPYENPAGVTVLSEEEILVKIIGNTLVGPSINYGPESEEYLHSDGTIKAAWIDENSKGFWAVSGSLICMYYPYQLPMWATPREICKYHCYTLKLDGDIVSYYSQNGRSILMKSLLLPGNARNL